MIDPSQKSLERLDRLGVSHTYCQTDDNILKWPYSYETYCQAQRFILLGHRLLDTQSVVVADVDAYALKEPSEDHKQTLFKDMAFTTFNDRLMATFCHFHSKRKKQALLAAETMTDNITQTDMIGVDQKVIKQFFKKLPYTELKNNVWIRHMNVKTEKDKLEHLKCLVYHEKGTRGKIKTVETTWTDIE